MSWFVEIRSSKHYVRRRRYKVHGFIMSRDKRGVIVPALVADVTKYSSTFVPIPASWDIVLVNQAAGRV